ncbi:phage head closure protein [Paenibacillus sp. 32O-W]|uniref:phage head closure protein n=1 Tax=Paenibacillus sp. 32O-W TaxID=1695218 RepID=UPI001C92DDD3|nr:phage head closure protein [Paenibacillus sp. 32O-W]
MKPNKYDPYNHSGMFNKRINVYGKVKFTNDQGKTAYRDEKIKTIWANIVPQTGRLQTQQADTILANVTHKIIVRYDAGKDILNNMYLVYRDHRFDIKYILNPYFKNETLEIFVEEVIG